MLSTRMGYGTLASTNVFLIIFFRKNTYFVDLFVRVSNKIAINMYKNLGYIVYRTVIEYYAGPGDLEEDAFGNIYCNCCWS